MRTTVTLDADTEQLVRQRMAERGEGKVLIVGSIAGHLAGSFQAVYNGTKAFIDSFAAALGNEIKDTGVTVTCLKPGATETEQAAAVTPGNALERARGVESMVKQGAAEQQKTIDDAISK